MRCKFETDVFGFYITPLFGISKHDGGYNIWFGWFFWLFTWVIKEIATSGNPPYDENKR